MHFKLVKKKSVIKINAQFLRFNIRLNEGEKIVKKNTVTVKREEKQIPNDLRISRNLLS